MPMHDVKLWVQLSPKDRLREVQTMAGEMGLGATDNGVARLVRLHVADIKVSRSLSRHAERQPCRQRDKQRETERPRDRETDIQTDNTSGEDIQTKSQADRRTDRQTDGQTPGRTDKIHRQGHTERQPGRHSDIRRDIHPETKPAIQTRYYNGGGCLFFWVAKAGGFGCEWLLIRKVRSSSFFGKCIPSAGENA